MLCNAVAIREAAGRVVEMQGSLLDITERKRNEESLRKLTQAVEQSPV